MEGDRGSVSGPSRGSGLWGSITDVPGIRVGHAAKTGGGWLTGVTVVIPPPGTVGAVDVRGGGPATHETDALAPGSLVPTVDAVCLSGGSAYGLAATSGVQRWCEEQGRGYPVGPPDAPESVVVPIVAGASLFDVGRGGDPKARPGPDLGYLAAAAAGTSPAGIGPCGAGTGAVCAFGALAGGVGSACVQVECGEGTVAVGALIVVNAAGIPFDPVDGALLGRAFVPADRPRPRVPGAEEAAALRGLVSQARARGHRLQAGLNTTLAVVATQADIPRTDARRLATCGHDGLARALSPIHTLIDGDAVFALATGEVPVAPPNIFALQAAAATAVTLATMDAVLAARGLPDHGSGRRGYLDLCPSAVPSGPPLAG